jgi:hypothetical protein
MWIFEVLGTLVALFIALIVLTLLVVSGVFFIGLIFAIPITLLMVL